MPRVAADVAVAAAEPVERGRIDPSICATIAYMSSVPVLERRIYGMRDIDLYLRLPAGTARRWIDGYTRAGKSYPPVIREEQSGDETASWGEVVETRLLSEYRDRGVSVQRLRPAVQRLRDELNTPYPLAHSHTLLDVVGKELVLRVQQGTDPDPSLAMVVVRSGQLQLTDPAQHFVDRVSFASGYAASLLGDTEGLVTLDPLRAMGRWSVRAVPTEVLAEGFRAGESIESLASLYELQIDEVTAALRFEMQQTQPRSA